MYLSGSLKDLLHILVMADDVRADAIHFVAPNMVFIAAKNKEDYIYLKSGLVVGYSVLVPKVSYQNLLLYIKTAKRGFHQKTSPFYQKELTSAIITPGRILFNASEEAAMLVEIPTYPLKKEVDFKLEETIIPSYDRETPFLRLTPSQLLEIQQLMNKYKKRHGSAKQKSVDNAIQIEGDQLVLYFFINDRLVRIETDIREFAFNFGELSAIHFSDKAFYLMRWMTKTTLVEDVIILPRSGYCIMEGYHDEMVAKVRMSLKNDLYLEESCDK